MAATRMHCYAPQDSPADAADIGHEAARGGDAVALGLGLRLVVLGQRERLPLAAQHRAAVARVRDPQLAALHHRHHRRAPRLRARAQARFKSWPCL